jgi:hypothetical protein
MLNPDEATPALNPRAEAMDAIAASARERRDEELGDDVTLEEIAGIAPEPEPEPAPEPIEELDNIKPTSDTGLIEREGQQYLKLKVNGAEREMPLSAAIEELQKGVNADVQTQVAVEARQRYEALTKELAIQPPLSTQPDDAEARRAETKQAITAALNTLYEDGDVDKSSEALTDLIAGMAQPAAQAPAVIDEALVERVVAKREDKRTLKAAYDNFAGTDRYKRIVDDPDLLTLLDIQTDRMQKDTAYMATNPSYHDTFVKAGEAVLTKLGVPPERSESEKIVDLKRRQTAAPSRTSRRAAPAPEQPKTTTDIISDIAKQRGQAGY